MTDNKINDFANACLGDVLLEIKEEPTFESIMKMKLKLKNHAIKYLEGKKQNEHDRISKKQCERQHQ